MAPLAAGYWMTAANASAGSSAPALPLVNSTPMGRARVPTTSTVWGKTSSHTKSFRRPCFSAFNARNTASAAAVPSSSMEALAISMAVRSVTIVWKFSSASRRPWEISGWYGV